MAKYISIYFDIFQQKLNRKIIAKKISRRGRPASPCVSREVFVKGSLWCEKLLGCGFGPALESKQIIKKHCFLSLGHGVKNDLDCIKCFIQMENKCIMQIIMPDFQGSLLMKAICTSSRCCGHLKRILGKIDKKIWPKTKGRVPIIKMEI